MSLTLDQPAARTLVIESRVEQLSLVEDFVEELRDTLNFKEDVYGNILVAVTEAANNGILHGNQNDAQKTVTIRSELVTPYCLQIVVADQGTGFDHTNRKDPTAPENLLSEHGRGVFVMEHLADNIEFLGNGNTVQMQFNI